MKLFIVTDIDSTKYKVGDKVSEIKAYDANQLVDVIHFWKKAYYVYEIDPVYIDKYSIFYICKDVEIKNKRCIWDTPSLYRPIINNNGHNISRVRCPNEEDSLSAVKQNGGAIIWIKEPSDDVIVAAVKENKYVMKLLEKRYKIYGGPYNPNSLPSIK